MSSLVTARRWSLGASALIVGAVLVGCNVVLGLGGLTGPSPDASSLLDAGDGGGSDGDATAPMDGASSTVCDGGSFVLCNGACVPNTGEPAFDPCVLTETSGIYVAPSGSDGATGSQSAPVQSLSLGVSLAKTQGKPVFVCDATYTEALSFTSSVDGVKVYGGLVCPGTGVANAWGYEAGQVVIAPTTAGTTALTVNGLTVGMTFEDFAFGSTGATGVDSNGNGNSSIAVVVTSSQNVVFMRVTMTAGEGAGGDPGGTDGGNSEPMAGQGAGPPDASPSNEGLGCNQVCSKWQWRNPGGQWRIRCSLRIGRPGRWDRRASVRRNQR